VTPLAGIPSMALFIRVTLVIALAIVAFVVLFFILKIVVIAALIAALVIGGALAVNAVRRRFAPVRQPTIYR
jgi:hypothetical protein